MLNEHDLRAFGQIRIAQHAKKHHLVLGVCVRGTASVIKDGDDLYAETVTAGAKMKKSERNKMFADMMVRALKPLLTITLM